jgi:gliding motility-associated-like protein
MSRILLFFCVFFSSLTFAQCSLEISDTTHVNCKGESTGAITFNIINAVQPYSLNLSNGSVVVDGNQFLNLSAGQYQVVLSDANLCTDTVNIKIKEPSLLTLNLKCDNGSLVAEVDGGVRPYSYFWRDSSAAIFSTDSSVSFMPEQLYDFEVIDEKGCAITDSVLLSVDFTVDKDLGDVPLAIQLVNSSSPGVYNWDFDDGETSFDQNPQHEYEMVGSYNLSLQLTDEHECTDEKTILVEVQGFDLSLNDWENMFNAFSPNGDGINDNFSFIENNAISDFSVKIYNRWGAVVYDWTDPNFEWNGLSYEGNNLTQGVYYFYMNATGLDGKKYEKKGSISIFY